MRTKLNAWLPAIVLICWCGLFAGSLSAQQQKAAALKQSIAANQKLLRQYKWTETTVIKLKGEEKSRTQRLCFYGPDGKVRKQQLSGPPQQQAPGGVKGKVVARKKEEISDYMKDAVAVVHQYVPPDKQRIDAVVAAGALSVTSPSGGATILTLKNYVKTGDEFAISTDTANNSIQTIGVKSYLQSQKDAITMSVTFARQGDGLSYPATIVLNAPEKKIEVTVQNSNYQKGAAPVPSTGGGSTPQGIDPLTGPIALYPDALVAQILDASTNPGEVQEFSNWLEQNANLKGGEVQEAASKAGFDAAFIALSLFPDVIQMMAQKPDWTKQLGEAFKADAQAVSKSIQRLRQQAQAMGNLKSSRQQEVVTQKASGGEQVIVIQPANPQVVYVPQYNPQVVYVQPAPPPSPSAAGAAIVGFTAGVLVGAAVNNNSYYHGPYAWHRPPGAAPYAYNYNNAAALQQQRYNNASNLQNQKQVNDQQNSSQRQSASQANQSQRQSASQANQSQRQSVASGAQSQATANQAQRQSAATSSRGSGQTASQRSGMNSGGLSGYQSGSAARAESQRGNRSAASSHSGGGARRR